MRLMKGEEASRKVVGNGPTKGWTARFLDRTLEGDLARKVLVIVLVGLLLYGATIVLDGLVLRPFFGDVLSEPTDLEFYRERAQNILDGQIPYVDFQSESPPLIMYMFTIPQLAGGSTLAYQIFFALFAVMTAVVIFLGLRAKDERKAMAAALLYLSYPLGLMEFGIGVQDEAITTFLFVLPLILLLIGRGGMSGAASFAGVLTKMFNVIVLPWMVLRSEGRERKLMLLALVGLGLALIVPFLLLYPDQIPSFRYYFLGNPDYPTGGSSISPWHYLNKLGFGLSGWAGVALTLTGLGASTLYALMRRMPLWQGATLVTMSFFLLYPKILLVYFMMPAVLLLMWSVEDRRMYMKLAFMIVPLFLSVAITGNGMNPLADEAWVWLTGMALSILGWGTMFHAWWGIRDRPVFFEREPDA